MASSIPAKYTAVVLLTWADGDLDEDNTRADVAMKAVALGDLPWTRESSETYTVPYSVHSDDGVRQQATDQLSRGLARLHDRNIFCLSAHILVSKVIGRGQIGSVSNPPAQQESKSSDPWAALPSAKSLRPPVDHSALVAKVISAIKAADDLNQTEVEVGPLILSHISSLTAASAFQETLKKKLGPKGYMVSCLNLTKDSWVREYQCIISWFKFDE